MSKLTLVVVGKDAESLASFNRENLDGVALELVVNQPMRSLAAIGNEYLRNARTPVVGLVHPDTGYGPGAIDVFIREAMADKVCGIVGITEFCEYTWCFNGAPRNVETLDSCSVFLRRDLGLSFDEVVFDGLHCHVQDLCMQAHARGIPVVVPKCQATHTGGPPFPEWRAEYERYRVRLCNKWGREVKIT